MTTTKSASIPARVTWFGMMWMILEQDTALAPYLKYWKRENPYRILRLIRISMLSAIGGALICVLAVQFATNENMSFYVRLTGASFVVTEFVIGCLQTLCLYKTVSAFQLIWNANAMEILIAEPLKTLRLMAPTASKVLDLERTGEEKFPRGKREKKRLRKKIVHFCKTCQSFSSLLEKLDIEDCDRLVFKFARGD